MSKKTQARFTHECDRSRVGWNAAITEAERQIETAQARIIKLRISIRTFEEMEARGEPFPYENSLPNDAQT